MKENQEIKSVTKKSNRLQINTTKYLASDIGIKSDIYLMNGQIELVKYDTYVEIHIKGCSNLINPNTVSKNYKNIKSTVQLSLNQFEEFKNQIADL